MRLNQLVFHISKCPEEYTGTKQIELPESGGSIGRNPGSTVPLIDHNRFISGTHCLVSVYGDTYYLSDVSTNGTLINGNKLLKNQPVSLYEGDNIVLGRYEITVEIEKLSKSLDIAADLAPERDTIDPLVGLGPEVMKEEQVDGCIDDLFIETQSNEVDSHDPIAHLNFTMQKDDDYLIKGDEPEESKQDQPIVHRQIPDDSLSVHSQFEVPNLIPEDWMNAVKEQPELESESIDLTAEHQSVHRPTISTSPDIKTVQESAAKAEETRQKANYWEEVTQTIPMSHDEPDKKKDVAPQMTVEQPEPHKLAGIDQSLISAFCRGLGVNDSALVSGDETFFRQMGACLRLCIDKLQKDLSEVEDLKQQGEQEVLSTDLAELMLTLNQQQLLSPNELIEQMLDELDEHRVMYNQAVNDAIYTCLKAGDPQHFSDRLVAETRFVTKGKLWNEYNQFYRDHQKEAIDVTGMSMQRKIKEHYHKNLKVKNA